MTARTAPLAEQAKDAALELRGFGDRERAEAELQAASENLAEALVQSAEADPEVGDDELRRLRTDLARELERLSAGDAGPAGSAPGASTRGVGFRPPLPPPGAGP